MSSASAPTLRRRKIAEYFDSLDSIDFSEKWLVCRVGSGDVLGRPKGGVFASEAEATEARGKTMDPNDWEVVGPVRFATANSDNWWFKSSGEPHFMALELKSDEAGKLKLVVKLADHSTLELDTSDPKVGFDLFLFSGEA